MAKRWILTQDQSSHWYLVPESKRREWDAWCEISDDDDRSWEPPPYAVSVGGAPSCLVTFEKPNLDGKPVEGKA